MRAVADDVVQITSARTSDYATLKTKFAKVRFAYNSSNRDISGIALGNSIVLNFPIPDVFESHTMTNVAVGTGNGTEDTFTIPKPTPTDLSVKVDGSVVTNYQTEIKDISQIAQTLSGVGTGAGYGVAITSDGKTIATASYLSTPYFTVHKRDAVSGKYDNTQTLSGVGDGGMA